MRLDTCKAVMHSLNYAKQALGCCLIDILSVLPFIQDNYGSRDGSVTKRCRFQKINLPLYALEMLEYVKHKILGHLFTLIAVHIRTLFDMHLTSMIYIWWS